MELKRLLSLLAGGWRVLLLAVACCVALACAAVIVQPRTYASTAVDVVTVQQGANDGSDDGGFATQAVAGYARIAVTPFVLGRVRERLGLTESVADLADRVTVTPSADTSVLEITARSAAADASARLANAVSDELVSSVERLTPQQAKGSSIQIVQLQQAVPPAAPASPSAPLYLVLAIVVGLLLGAGLVIVRELSRSPIRSSSDAETALGVPVVGVLPRSRRGRPASAVARRIEAFRTLRTNALPLLPSGDDRALLVAGVTGAPIAATATGLATAFAGTGRSVLLIDADLRDGVAAIGDAGAPGLAELLEGDAPLESVVHRPDQHGPAVVGAGSAGERSADLLQSRRMAELVAEAVERYDLVILAGAPVPEVTDAAVVGGLVSGVLLVLPLGRTRRSLQDAADALAGGGGRLLGVVLAPLDRRPRAAATSARAPRPLAASGASANS